MPLPDPEDRINYRSKARAHVKAARERLEAADPFGSVYACLHSRFAIEALAYELLQDYLSEVSPEAMSRWTPKAVLNDLLNISDDACSPISLTIGLNPGKDEPQQTITLDSHRFSAEWANKMHNALGSFLHQPTIRQLRREPEADIPGLARQKAEQALSELERVLASKVWSFRAHRLVKTTCKCGYLVARDIEFLNAGKEVICSDCGRAYNYRLAEARKRFEFWPQQAAWTCRYCETKHETDAYVAKPGKIVQCFTCSKKFKLQASMVLIPLETE